MKIFITLEAIVEDMPASAVLKASSAAMAFIIVSSAALLWPVSPPVDEYMATSRLAAGSVMCAGSLLLSKAIGETFLSGHGRRAFKALYCASLASAAAGLCEAASAFMAINTGAVLLGALALFAGAGLALLWLYREVK